MSAGRYPTLSGSDNTKYFEDEIARRFALQEEFLGTEKPVNGVEPVVSVWVITYQHRDYIQECLDSLLAQQTDFPFEIVIGEDQSTDGTRDVCIEYARRHPDRIRLFLRDRTISTLTVDGRLRYLNGILTHSACRGRYVAGCEGDDYWINPAKLQMQVDLLERDPGIGLVHGEAHCYHQKTRYWSRNLHKQRQDLDISDGLFQALIEARYRVITCTAMYRKELYDQIESNLSYRRARQLFFIGDVTTWLELSRVSRFGFIDEPLGVYRLLQESASRSRDPKRRLSFGLEMLWLRVLYMEHYGVPDEFFRRIVKQRARTMLELAAYLGEPDVADDLWELLVKANAENSRWDRFFWRCASVKGGGLLAAAAQRIRWRLAPIGAEDND